MPDVICRELQGSGVDNLRITVGENLSYPEERIVQGDVQQISEMAFDKLAIMLIEQVKSVTQSFNRVVAPGLPDCSFVQGDAPITKEEIRAVSMAKLRLRIGDRVYDIGAGTGSVTIESACYCQRGSVYAIEKNPTALALVLENIQRFGLTNVQIINGEAPQVLEGLPEPDRVFIGGSDGKLAEIIKWLSNCKKSLRVVINSITLETTYEAMDCLARNGFNNIESVNVAITRSQQIGTKHLMKAINPVTIISADKGEA